MDSLVRKEVGQLPILIVAGHGGSAKEQTPLGALQRRLLVERQPPVEGDAEQKRADGDGGGSSWTSEWRYCDRVRDARSSNSVEA